MRDSASGLDEQPDSQKFGEKQQEGIVRGQNGLRNDQNTATECATVWHPVLSPNGTAKCGLYGK